MPAPMPRAEPVTMTTFLLTDPLIGFSFIDIAHHGNAEARCNDDHGAAPACSERQLRWTGRQETLGSERRSPQARATPQISLHSTSSRAVVGLPPALRAPRPNAVRRRSIAA